MTRDSRPFSRRGFCAGLGAAAAAGFVLPGTARANAPMSVRGVPPMLGKVQSYVCRAEDTLIDLARKFNLGFIELAAANLGVDAWVPGKGTQLILPTGHLLPSGPYTGLVLNIADMRLYHFPAGRAPESFPIGVGREGLVTPRGTTTVKRKQKGPTWYPTASTRKDKPELPAAVPPGPDNPLGAYALYLGWQSYLIHGTNLPDGVGRRVSRGCIRMYPESIEHLFQVVPVGTPVRVVYEQVKVAWVDSDLLLEVHPSTDQADELEETGRLTPAIPPDLNDRVRAAAANQVERIDWQKVQRAGVQRTGVPISILKDEAVSRTGATQEY